PTETGGVELAFSYPRLQSSREAARRNRREHSMNTITVVGNLTRDPELRYTPTGQAVVKFGIAVNRFYTNRNGERVEQTDFFGVRGPGAPLLACGSHSTRPV